MKPFWASAFIILNCLIYDSVTLHGGTWQFINPFLYFSVNLKYLCVSMWTSSITNEFEGEIRIRCFNQWDANQVSLGGPRCLKKRNLDLYYQYRFVEERGKIVDARKTGKEHRRREFELKKVWTPPAD